MHEIIMAKSAGFCFGVEKAVREVYTCIEDATKTGLPVYTYGEIIHNESVLTDLEEKGVRIIADINDEATCSEGAGGDVKSAFVTGLPEEGVVIIRAHGVSEEVETVLRKSRLTVVDATCPFVKRIHKIVREASEKGETVVVFGHKDHPEVRGIVGQVKGPFVVVESKEEAEAFLETGVPRDIFFTIVSQTTMETGKFQETVELFALKGYNTHVANTICNATGERQKEAAEIAANVDAMIVIGGAHSSNTRRLYEICNSKCAHTYLVQTLGDLRGKLTGREKRIGITAGASTPKNIIQEVQTYVRTGTIV